MQNVKDVLAQKDTVLFIGSGVSLWSGLPTWSGMIEELAIFIELNGTKADLVRSEAQKGDLLQAASYAFDKLTKQQIGDFIRTACRYGKAKPELIHQRIVTLGPRCFITTNYDDLLEQALRKWQPDHFYRPPITNRQLTETAEIVHARAIDFIFKPHGDAGDSDSIILTREQYRQLLPNGERQAALESVKLLLASRPVVYIGFGLKDPDFIYVRDLLANTYKGGTRDHYAIMADVNEQEIDYWRRNYGIHLLNYETIARTDGSRDHQLLLSLLDSLIMTPKIDVGEAIPFDPEAPDTVLALARHASALGRVPRLPHEFPIRVHSEPPTNGKSSKHYSENFSVEKFLDSGAEQAILIGLPGAGKSYSLRRAAARLAERLHEICLAENFDLDKVVVPIFVDLKLYRGDLLQLVDQTLPRSLRFDRLIESFRVKVFVDSFNEMPREYWENGSYEPDFLQFAKALGQSALIIGSRTTDGLAKLQLPAYYLNEIDESAVSAELRRLGISFEGRFSKEIRSLLQRPFYFQYIISGSIKLRSDAHPRDFYRLLFQNTNDAFEARFGDRPDFERILSGVAYDALNQGEEAFPISSLLIALENVVKDDATKWNVSPRDVTNWLVSASLLLPYSGSRVAFIHQSVTEYLAATELARRYLVESTALQEKLKLMRWDQALFLTLSLLPEGVAEAFLQDVIKADFALALNAAKYLEFGRDEIVAKLLSEIPDRFSNELFDWKINFAVESGLPITEVQIPELRSIIAGGGALGASAAYRIISMKGRSVKLEFLKLMSEKRGDFNFCNRLGEALREYATDDDVKLVRQFLSGIAIDHQASFDEEKISGFIAGASQFLSRVDLAIIRRELLVTDSSSGTIGTLQTNLLCNILQKRKDSPALEIAGELLLSGAKEAPAAIYFIGRLPEAGANLSWGTFSHSHVECLDAILTIGGDWMALDALKCICAARADLAELVTQLATKKNALQRAALLYCSVPNDWAPIFAALKELIRTSDSDRREISFEVLKQIRWDWTGQTPLFVDILLSRDAPFISALLGHSLPPYLPSLGTLDVGAPEQFLEWMREIEHSGKEPWFGVRLGGLLGSHLSLHGKEAFLAEFNREDSKYLRLLQVSIMPYLDDLTSDKLTDSAISFLLADISRIGGVQEWPGHLLGAIATERFVSERLVPLLSGASATLTENLKKVLAQAGKRHGRRYAIGC
jgi:hypothetical protein